MEHSEFDLDPALNCQVRYPSGMLGEIVTRAVALEHLESAPFSSLEIWNGRCWEVVWNGAVEFEGVAPC